MNNFVDVEGHSCANSSTIQTVFDLSWTVIGGSRFLITLQENAPYLARSGYWLLIQTACPPPSDNGTSRTVVESTRFVSVPTFVLVFTDGSSK